MESMREGKRERKREKGKERRRRSKKEKPQSTASALQYKGHDFLKGIVKLSFYHVKNHCHQTPSQDRVEPACHLSEIMAGLSLSLILTQSAASSR